jgi:hypothetical protein
MKQIIVATSIAGLMMWASVSYGQDIKSNQKTAPQRTFNIKNNKAVVQKPMLQNGADSKPANAAQVKPGLNNSTELTPSEKRHLRK